MFYPFYVLLNLPMPNWLCLVTLSKCCGIGLYTSMSSSFSFSSFSLCLPSYVRKLDARSHNVWTFLSLLPPSYWEILNFVCATTTTKAAHFFGSHPLCKRFVYSVSSNRYVQPDSFACTAISAAFKKKHTFFKSTFFYFILNCKYSSDFKVRPGIDLYVALKCK